MASLRRGYAGILLSSVIINVQVLLPGLPTSHTNPALAFRSILLWPSRGLWVSKFRSWAKANHPRADASRLIRAVPAKYSRTSNVLHHQEGCTSFFIHEIISRIARKASDPSVTVAVHCTNG